MALPEKGIIIAHSLTQPAHQSGLGLCVALHPPSLSPQPTRSQPSTERVQTGQETGRTKAFVDSSSSAMDPGGDDLTHQQPGERWGQGHSKQDVTLEYAINTEMPSAHSGGLFHSTTYCHGPPTHTHTHTMQADWVWAVETNTDSCSNTWTHSRTLTHM